MYEWSSIADNSHSWTFKINFLKNYKTQSVWKKNFLTQHSIPKKHNPPSKQAVHIIYGHHNLFISFLSRKLYYILRVNFPTQSSPQSIKLYEHKISQRQKKTGCTIYMYKKAVIFYLFSLFKLFFVRKVVSRYTQLRKITFLRHPIFP